MNNDYKLLTAHFFKGTLRGQIKSLWKKKDIKERIEEYKKALAAGHVRLDESLNKAQVRKLEYMGIPVPEELRPLKKEKASERIQRNPDEVRLTNKQVRRMLDLGVTPPKEMMPLRLAKKPRKQKTVETTSVVPDAQETVLPKVSTSY